MTTAEVKVFDTLLEDLDNYYGNAGCNDMILPDTPENRKIVMLATEAKNETELSIEKGKINTVDFMILAYLRKRLRETASDK